MAADLGDILTLSARWLYPFARSKGLGFHFDCTHERVAVASGYATLLLCAAYRLACAVIETMDAGAVSMYAELSRGLIFSLGIEGAGRLGRDGQSFDSMARRLGLQAMSAKLSGHAGTRMAEGICPRTGGTVQFSRVKAGHVHACLELHGAGILERSKHDAPMPHAHGAPLWLVSADAEAAQNPVRQFASLGWKVSTFADCSQVLGDLGERTSVGPPRLLLVLAERAEDLAGIQALARHLPSETRRVCAVPAGSVFLGQRHALAGFEVRVMPFGPHNVMDVTEALQAGLGSREDSATLRDLDVLVVDDLPMACQWLADLVRATGHRPRVASGGHQAIVECRRQTPDVVLMNVGMPDLDGIEATRRMRSLQWHGDLPPFNVVGHTVSWSPQVQASCIQAGMLDCLSSVSPPLTPAFLQPCLTRACQLN